MEVNRHEILEQKMCKELDTIEEKYRGGGDMSTQDLDKIDKLVHALKSLATYRAMKEAEEYSEDRRMQNISGRPYPPRMSYDMRGMSGTYEPYPGYYRDQTARW